MYSQVLYNELSRKAMKTHDAIQTFDACAVPGSRSITPTTEQIVSEQLESDHPLVEEQLPTLKICLGRDILLMLLPSDADAAHAAAFCCRGCPSPPNFCS